MLGRVAQSMTDRTSVSLQYSRRDSFGALPTAVVTTPALFFDDGVYDDPYASDAGALRVSLKRLLRNGMTIDGMGVWVRKDYRGTVALDARGHRSRRATFAPTGSGRPARRGRYRRFASGPARSASTSSSTTATRVTGRTTRSTTTRPTAFGFGVSMAY